MCLILVWPLSAGQVMLRVRVRDASGAKVNEISLERYVAAVLVGEGSLYQSKEALKAMAVAVRTYAVRMRGRHGSEGFDFCDSAHCQRVDLTEAPARLQEAAKETAGELLWFQGKPAFTPYSRDCGGRTEEAVNVWPELAAPYLKSQPDPHCPRSGPDANWRWTIESAKVEAALRKASLRSPSTLSGITILQRTPSGRATVLLLDGSEAIRISAGSFRLAIGREMGWNTVRSDRYSVRAGVGRLSFEGVGEGHGVGLCQRGSEAMGRSGSSYRQILAFYYPGAAVGATSPDPSWQRLQGESITLLTTQPDQDRAVLSSAERLAQSIAARTSWRIRSDVELRVYPDLDTFRNATGEPGWVAAHSQGGRIYLQPAASLRSRGVLDSTLAHELLHVFIEAEAAPSLPLWFREGLAEYLQGHQPSAEARVPAEADLRQTADQARARRAYDGATAAVNKLVSAYGETVVLGWVRRGLPAEVAAASASQQPAKSR